LDQLTYHIHLYDQHISETMLVSQFLLGLKDELRQYVEMHLPTSVPKDATLAAIQKQLNTRPKLHQKKYVSAKPDSKAAFSSNELWKARQLKEYRRANNLYFKCGDKYTC
jgi:hypothetical protein